MKKYGLLFVLITLISCKSKSVAVMDIPKENKYMTSSVIEKLYQNKNNFSTLYIKSSANYADEKMTQNVTAEIKIKKDEQILVSVRFLGITMAKALITPEGVSYYEKINGSYFEGDFKGLSQWLGTDLDYSKIQNLLVGQAIDDLSKGKYKETLEADEKYKLEDLSKDNTQKYFFIDALKFVLQKQEIAQAKEGRSIAVAYGNFAQHTNMILPSNVQIVASQPKGNTEINLNYNSISVNEALSFPYSVPSGYKRILIK
ncbi:hypothetical protein BXU11_01930 [Flavobacterium sp. LM5]|uniref:DUF4292 domain-containing protein n=1 Tax=Flavobacterium sp. LM5 TaxID=1938610 RepID=UPI000993CDA2|nr:DUF4292 domain-containing protein [Flavobacterium sp. LM5]OOV28728.1 hypothetical protein BXU11_01930 [Flavobacterium sp. LM5]